MKKITLLFLLLMSTSVFSQELVTNGDFESGSDPWYGNALNVQTDGGNSFNFANVETAGNAFDVNLSQLVTITAGDIYTLSFDASTGAGETRTMLVGIGQSESPFFANVEEVTLTEASQTFTLTLAATDDGTGNDFGGANSRVIFDMGADTGVVVIDNVSLMLDTSGGGDNMPTTAPPTPPSRDEASVISLYGDAYGDEVGLSNVTYDDPTNFTEVNIASNDVLQIDFDQFMGSTIGTVVDATAMTHFHMDIWIADDFVAGQVFNPKLSNHEGNMGETDAYDYTFAVGPDDVQTWVSIDVPLSAFIAIDVDGDGDVDRADLTEFLITVAGLIDRAYVDNIYLHQNTVLGIEDLRLEGISIYPNPTKNSWNFNTADNQISSVKVFDMLGKSIISIEPKSNNFKIDASNLSKGVYLARIESARGNKTIKLVKD